MGHELQALNTVLVREEKCAPVLQRVSRNRVGQSRCKRGLSDSHSIQDTNPAALSVQRILAPKTRHPKSHKASEMAR